MSIFRKELCVKESGSSPVLGFYCTTLQSVFTTTVAAVEVGIALPISLINQQKAILKKVQSFLFKKTMKEIDALEALILAVLRILDMKALKLGDLGGSDFCDALYDCTALIETLSSTLGIDLTDFNTFKRYVCKSDLSSTASSFVGDKLTGYINQLSQLVGEKKMVSVHTLYRSLGLDYEEEQRKIRQETIDEAIKVKEDEMLSKMSLTELRALGEDDEVPDIIEIPVPGESPNETPVAGEEESGGLGGGMSGGIPAPPSGAEGIE